MSQTQPTNLRRGFTLIEVSVTVIIISLLAAIVLVALGAARRNAQAIGERQVLVSLKNAIKAFENDFDFLPPLVHDNSARDSDHPLSESDASTVGPWPNISGGNDNRAGPIDRHPEYADQLQPVGVGESRDRARRDNERTFLEGFTSAANHQPVARDYRYSAYSLTFYLMGTLDFEDQGKPIDGATGPRITEPRADGSFTRRGKAREAFFDPSTQGKRLTPDETPGPYGAQVFADRWSRPTAPDIRAIRYYRWETRPGDRNAQPGSHDAETHTLVPRAVGDPRNDPKLRGARFALVSTGPDGYTDMRTPLEVGEADAPDPPLNAFTKDDIVEVEE